MRAIRLNPWNRTITEVDLDSDDDGITYEALRAAVFPPPLREGNIQRINLGAGVDAWCDEDGFMCDWDMQRFLALHPPGMKRMGQPVAGHVILTGADGWGNSVALPARINLSLVRDTVTWLDAREVTVEGTKVYSQTEDGRFKLEYDAGVWTYDNQP